jgi:hypothetical protein
MQRIDQSHFDTREPVRSTFAAGLRDVFVACHDPLPAKMEELLRRLQDRDRESSH